LEDTGQLHFTTALTLNKNNLILKTAGGIQRRPVSLQALMTLETGGKEI
jgi:hypothetical protein